MRMHKDKADKSLMAVATGLTVKEVEKILAN